jgi:hypothetical protein
VLHQLFQWHLLGASPVGRHVQACLHYQRYGNRPGPAVVDGIDGIVKYSTFNVYTTWRRDPANTTFATSCFIKRVVAHQYLPRRKSRKPPAIPPPAGILQWRHLQQRFANFAAGTSSSSRPVRGPRLRRGGQNINCAPPSTETRTYMVYIDVVDKLTAPYSTPRLRLILVPPVM